VPTNVESPPRNPSDVMRDPGPSRSSVAFEFEKQVIFSAAACWSTQTQRVDEDRRLLFGASPSRVVPERAVTPFFFFGLRAKSAFRSFAVCRGPG
jgi:hypothetical protein